MTSQNPLFRHAVSTPEVDLARYLDDEDAMDKRESRIIRLQEGWDKIVFHEPERGYCYLIFKRHGHYGKPLETGECISFDYGYETMAQAEAACERAFQDIAEERVDNDDS